MTVDEIRQVYARHGAAQNCYWGVFGKDNVGILLAEIDRLKSGVYVQEASAVPCHACNGPVVEFVVPAAVWNRVVRRDGPSHDREYLCWDCFFKLATYAESPHTSS